MDTKKIIWISVAICSIVAGFIPKLWGASLFSFASFMFNGLGGIVGLWLGYIIARG